MFPFSIGCSLSTVYCLLSTDSMIPRRILLFPGVVVHFYPLLAANQKHSCGDDGSDQQEPPGFIICKKLEKCCEKSSDCNTQPGDFKNSEHVRFGLMESFL